MARTGRQRLDAIPAAVERRDEFIGRVRETEGDAVRCADLMAEAIAMQIDANHLEAVRKSGNATICIEEVMAGHCLIAARDAYLRARGSNHRLTHPPIRARMERMALHFVRFPDRYGRQFQNAVRVFGPPHFLHRLWDRRAQREIAEGDVIVFAKGDQDQPVSPVNGNDEHYE